MNNAKTKINFLIFVIFLLGTQKCLSQVVLDRADLIINVLTENNYQVNLKAFKSSSNDEILSKEIKSKYNQLEWYSIGYPQLNKIKSNEYFVFKPFEFYVEIQMLNDPIRHKFKEEILKIHYLNISKEQVKNLELDQMQCSFEFQNEHDNTELVKFDGSVKSFNQYPLRLNFKYGRNLKDRKLFEEAIKIYNNKIDQLDIQIDCKISSKTYHDKFTIFTKQFLKTNELRIEDIEKILNLNEAKMTKMIEKYSTDLYKASKEIEIKILEDIKKEISLNNLNLEKKIEINEAKITRMIEKFIETETIMFENIKKENKERFDDIEIKLTDIKELKTLTGHSKWVRTLAVLPNGDLVSGSEDNTIKIWNTHEGKLLKTLNGLSSYVWTLAVLPNGDLMSIDIESTIKIWNINEGKVLKTLNGLSSYVWTLAVLPNGDLVTGSNDTTIKIWNINQGKELKKLTGHSGTTCSLVVLPNGDLASGSYDNTIKIWDTIKGIELKTLNGHSGSINKLVVLSNGDLASGSSDKTIKIWNIKEEKELKTLTGHTSLIYTLAVLQNGDLASGSYDNTIKIWDTIEGIELKTLSGHSSFVWNMAVLPNGDLVSGSDDKTIKIWNTKKFWSKKKLN